MNLKKIKKSFKKDTINWIIIIVSILALIIGSLSIGFLKTFIVLIILNAICFVPNIIKTKKKSKIKGNGKKEMPTTRTEKNLQQKKKKSILKTILLVGVCGIIFCILCGVGFFLYIVIQAPEFDASSLYTQEPTIIYDKDGNEVAKLGSEQRVLIEYKDIPEVLVDAIVATEDSRFFEHNGVDWARFLKASVGQILGNSDAGGASTLTMQVSKNSIVKDNTASGIKGIIRKFSDVYISMFKIEPNYTKEEIMEFYVNSYFLGNNAYGVEQASLTYFNKSAKDLNLSEAAMIAGLFQAPGKYDPFSNPEATENRRQTVLYLMKRHGYINDLEYEIAMDQTVEDIVVTSGEDTFKLGVSEHQSYIDVVVKEVKDLTGLNPYTTPMKIYTTMDSKVQSSINDIMNGETYTWENDVVQAGIAITNINDGSIVAVGGGRNIDKIDTTNHATSIERQIGSTAKPLYDYGPAIEYLGWSSGTIDPDEPVIYSDGTDVNNYDGSFQGIQTIRTALGGSRNIPALKAFQANSKDNIKEFVTNLGLSPEEYLHEAHSIGGYTGESPLSMAAAYAAFGNGGYYIKPYTTTKVIVQTTGETYETSIEKTRAMSDSTAYIVSDMLKTTAPTGVTMGGNYNIKGVKYAAKTGTTNHDDKTLKEYKMSSSAVNDIWVVGFDANYAIGVWYGYDYNSSDYYTKISSRENKKLFQAAGKLVFSKEPQTEMPDSVAKVTIEKDEPNNCLPSDYTPDSMKITELFVKGYEPDCVSTRYDKLSEPSNVSSKVDNGIITVSWSGISEPKIMSESYLRNYYGNVFKSDKGLNSYISSRLSYNSSNIGSLGYEVYVRDSNGNLTSLGFTTGTTYTHNVSEPGTYTFIVKSAYSIFKANMSEGKSASVVVRTDDLNVIIPTPENNENITNNETIETIPPDGNLLIQ